jgi:hypothetical protein
MSRIMPLMLATMVILPVALYHTGPTAAISATSTVDSRIRLDWEVGARHGGRLVIQGWVYNDDRRSAMDVHLLVETLDSSGNVIARDLGFVRGVVQSNARTYFEVPLKTTGATYRVSVTGFDWKGCDSGGGGA